MSQFYGVDTVIPASGQIKFSSFANLSANVPTVSNIDFISVPIISSNVSVSARGIISGVAGPTVAAIGSIDISSFRDVPQYKNMVSVSLFSSSNMLPVGFSFSNSILSINTNTPTNGAVPIMFKMTNYFGNYSLYQMQANILPANNSDATATQVAMYGGESFNSAAAMWIDASGKGMTATWTGGSNTTSTFGPNNRVYVHGSATNTLLIPSSVTPATQTIFTVARYAPGAASNFSIFCSSNMAWISGFGSNAAGVAVHGGSNMTPASDCGSGSTWVLSTDQNSLYRANGVTRSTGYTPGNTAPGQIGINLSGKYNSPFDVAAIAVYSSNLSATQIYATESNLANQYGICIALSNSSLTLSNNSMTLPLNKYFMNSVGYSATSPNANATVTGGSNLTISGASRYSTYYISVTGSNSLSVSTATQMISVTETMQPPSAVSTVPGQSNLTTGNYTLNIAPYFTGSVPTYLVTSNPQSNATASSSNLTIAANYRNTSYTIQVAASNAVGIAYQSVSVSETSLPTSTTVGAYPPASMTANTSTISAAYGSGVYVTTVSSTYGDPTYSAYHMFSSDSSWWASGPFKYNGTTGAYIGAVSTTASGTAYNGEWIQLQLPFAIKPTAYKYTIPYQISVATGAKTWVLVASSDGSTWTLIDSQASAPVLTSNAIQKSLTLGTYFSYFRFVILSDGGNDWVGGDLLQFIV